MVECIKALLISIALVAHPANYHHGANLDVWKKITVAYNILLLLMFIAFYVKIHVSVAVL